jgi:acylglycerol lipase
MGDITRAVPAANRAKYYADGGVEGPIFENAEGIEIVNTRFVPKRAEDEKESGIKALVFFVHGYGDHCHAPYITRFGKACVEHNMALFSCDLPGHGLSGGIRFDINAEAAMNTYEMFIDLTMKEFPGLPYFVVGESLGGAYSIIMSIKFNGRPGYLGTFLIAPAIHNDVEPPAIVTWLVKNCCSKCCPLARFPESVVPTLSPDMISGKKEIQDEIAADDLIDKLPFRLRSADAMLELTHEIQNRVKEIKFPFLILHGDADRVIPLSGSNFMFDECSTEAENKKLTVVPGGGHAAMGEVEGTDTYEGIFNWFNSRQDKQNNA